MTATYRDYYVEVQKRLVSTRWTNKAEVYVSTLYEFNRDLANRAERHDQALPSDDMGRRPRHLMIWPGYRYNRRIPRLLTFLRENWDRPDGRTRRRRDKNGRFAMAA